MKKYFSKILLASFVFVSVFMFGFFTKSTTVSAMNNCEFIEVLISVGVIQQVNANPVRLAYGCISPVTPTATITPPASTATTSLSVSCTANKDVANIYELVSWTASSTGAIGTTTYSWSGTDSLSGNSSSTLKSYTYEGVKRASVTVTSNQSSTNASCNLVITPVVTYYGFLGVNKSLVPGQVMSSKNGMYKLILHNTGNLVLYSSDKVLWETNTKGQSAGILLMQKDGNLVLYSKQGAVLWATMKLGNTNGLMLQNDGNMVISDLLFKTVIWSSNTQNSVTPIVGQVNPTYNLNATPVVNTENICTFDPVKYMDFYPEVKQFAQNDNNIAKWHWKNYGISEGRTPCGSDSPTCHFVESNYLTINPDVAAVSMNGLDHYLKWGLNEGRVVCKTISSASIDSSSNYATAMTAWDRVLRLIQALR